MSKTKKQIKEDLSAEDIKALKALIRKEVSKIFFDFSNTIFLFSPLIIRGIITFSIAVKSVNKLLS